jgi:hypothetical protein
MPVAIAAAGLAVSVAGTVAAISAAHQQAQNAQAADNYNQQVASNNAQVASWQRSQQNQEFATEAYMTQQQGAQDASRMEMSDQAQMAKNVAAAAASGLTLSGSTNSAIAGSAANNELAVNNEEYKTRVSAYQNQIGAANAEYNSTLQVNRYDDESQLLGMESHQAGVTGMYNEAGAGIRGASSILTAGNALGQRVDPKMFD